MDKFREALRPIYKQFVASHITRNNLPLIPFPDFCQAVKDVLQDSITEHEIITLARQYSGDQHDMELSCQNIQSMVQNELKRFLFSAFERMEETFRYRDPNKTGRVSKNVAYSILRGANLPVDKDMVLLLLDRMVDGQCMIDYCKLLEFINYKKNPTQPISDITNFTAKKNTPISVNIKCVNLEKLIKDVDLEKTLLDNN